MKYDCLIPYPDNADFQTKKARLTAGSSFG
jgi:hypothetical protein